MAICYYPVLKWKMGEKVALQNLVDRRESFIPIIEVVDTIEPQAFFLDVQRYFTGEFYYSLIDDEFDNEDCVTFAQYALDHHILANPVVFQSNIADVLPQIHNSHVAVKLMVPGPMDDLDLVGAFHYVLDNTCDGTHLSIILDSGEILDERSASQMFRNLIGVFDNNSDMILNLRAIIISLTSFPSRLETPAGENEEFSRYDISIFRNICQRYHEANWRDRLSYSDFGVTKFTDTEVDFTRMRYGVLPKVKYTAANSYRVLKGARDREHNVYTRSYIDIAREITRSDFFYGRNFSYGDQMIFDKANTPNVRPGGARDWVSFCANHHIAVVIDELSRIDGF